MMHLIKSKDEWNKVLDEEFSDYSDVYYKYEYFELYREEYNVDMEGIFWEDGNIKIFWTHLIRDISKIDKFKVFEFYDLTTPYGYGGPIITKKIKDRDKINNSIKDFFVEYENYALKNDYICEFIRFHPIFKNWELLDDFFEIKHTNNIVVVDLGLDKERLWGNIKKGHRYNIKKSMERGIKIQIVKNPRELEIEKFTSMYHETMNKNEASEKYFFAQKFISNHFDLLDAILVKAEYNNEIVSASIFLLGRHFTHYHLSGSKIMRGLYPNDLMLWSMITWAKNNNFKLFNLGGGIGKNDSLFKFKKGFSDNFFPFYIGNKIFNIKMYKELQFLNPLSKELNSYFPAYRQGLDKTIV